MLSLEHFMIQWMALRGTTPPEMAEKAYRDYRISYFAGQAPPIPAWFYADMKEAANADRIQFQRQIDWPITWATALVDALEAREGGE